MYACVHLNMRKAYDCLTDTLHPLPFPVSVYHHVYCGLSIGKLSVNDLLSL